MGKPTKRQILTTSIENEHIAYYFLRHVSRGPHYLKWKVRKSIIIDIQRKMLISYLPFIIISS